MSFVTVKSWPLDRDRTHQMKSRGMRYKMYQKRTSLDRDRTSDVFFVDLIRAVITPQIDGSN